MSNLPEGWDTYDPNDHERSTEPPTRPPGPARPSEPSAAVARTGDACCAAPCPFAHPSSPGRPARCGPGEVSRVEHQTDLLLSTFARYVEAMGGDLAVVVRFGGHDVIELKPRSGRPRRRGEPPDAAVQPDPWPWQSLRFTTVATTTKKRSTFAELAA